MRKIKNKPMTRIPALLLAILVILLTINTEATDCFYSDTEGKSASGRCVVTAKSPENQGGERNSFQANFVYTCTDIQSGKILWTRKQPMGKAVPLGGDPSRTHSFPDEGSPVSIYVSDSAHTAIYTGYQELVLINITGKETSKIDVLEDGLTKNEREKYVSETTAGPMWTGRSHWYFVEAESQEYFVIRTWWGRHVIFDLSTGKITPLTEVIRKATAEAEKAFVIHAFQGVLDGTLKKCDGCGGPQEAAFAAYLAGVLSIKEAIPALRKLEGDTSIGSSTTGGYDEIPQGRVDPFDYSSYTTRQSIHLALRRLGEKPGPFPCTQFKTEHKDYDKMKPYVREPVPGSRHTNATKILKGMSPEQVINLVDCPDYMPDRIWQYDIDADEPYTLALSWSDDQKVKEIEFIRPALWKEGTLRDAND
jgi:hypothetical protein